jgi:hypothetical protein
MRYKTAVRQLNTWGIPALYAGAAMLAGLTFPRIESRLFPGLVMAMNVSSATAIYSSIASGMMALTGIVFSLAFVMVQFSATAYSPRLVLLVARKFGDVARTGNIHGDLSLCDCRSRRSRSKRFREGSFRECLGSGGSTPRQRRHVYRPDKSNRPPSD